jgi:haloalkane dehalogenase
MVEYMAWAEKETIEVAGKNMAYVEMGAGDPIIFQHGNPTSSFLWRNIMPGIKDLGRCIAIDLIGMGDSEKLDNPGPDRYTFAEHREYFDAALEALGVTSNVTLVIHDWGSALGFDWANRHRDSVRGICYMEGIVRPVTWDEFPELARGVFQGFRSDAGEVMVLENNVFVEKILPGSIIRSLSEEEMAEYRRPFLNAGEDRRPTLTWPRQIPIAGEPEDVVAITRDYSQWMLTNTIPKLFINAEPGALVQGATREFCRLWPNQTEVTVSGKHFIQEDSPVEITQAIADWLRKIQD